MHGSRVQHTNASLAAAAGTGLLAAVQGARLLSESRAATYLDAITVVAAGLACVATLKMCRDNCFEARLLAVVLALAGGLGAMLTVTIGHPGDPAHPPTLGDIALMALGVAVPLLVVLDQRLRRRGATGRPMLPGHGPTRARRRGRRPDRSPTDQDSGA